MENMIEVTGCDLVELAKAAYDLSVPQGLGFLHFEEGGLSDDEAKSLIKEDSLSPLSLDYVKGRACKLTVFKDNDRLYINDKWFDHTEGQLAELVSRIN